MPGIAFHGAKKTCFAAGQKAKVSGMQLGVKPTSLGTAPASDSHSEVVWRGLAQARPRHA